MVGRGLGIPRWCGAAVAVLALLAAPLACDESPATEDSCKIKSICARSCATDADCPEYQFCAPRDIFTNERRCQTGCRNDSQCSPDFCVFGSCQAGCREDEHCPDGQICAFFNILGGGEDVGQCIEGCRSNVECFEGEHCVCGSCRRSTCDSNDDCGPDEYCPTGANELGVERCAIECRPLLPPVACGEALCKATSIFASVQKVAVPACCAGTSECGLDTSAVLAFAARCQALAQPGEVDPSCGPDSGFSSGPLPACRRPDGRCGYLVDVLGLGCVARDR